MLSLLSSRPQLQAVLSLSHAQEHSMTDEHHLVGAGASNSMTDRLLNSSLSAGVSAVVNTTVSTIAEASQIDRLVQLGKTADDDDETHPGLERPFSKQQELRL